MVGFRSGFVAVIGRPNVGKSSLVNALVGEKVAIVSDKPQTTRNRIMGVVNGEGYQMVLVDTPGLQKPRNRLGSYMEGAAVGSLVDVDAVMVVIDAKGGIGAKDEDALVRAEKSGAPVVYVANKTDLIDDGERQRCVDALRARAASHPVVACSAKTGFGLYELLKALLANMHEGPAYFPIDAVTDKPESFICAEIVREKALLLLRDEVPHGIGVELERFMEREDGVVEIHAIIYCERTAHKAIVIGKNGAMLKKIGTLARQECEILFGAKVFLKLYVKAREDWRNSPLALKELGYD